MRQSLVINMAMKRFRFLNVMAIMILLKMYTNLVICMYRNPCAHRMEIAGTGRLVNDKINGPHPSLTSLPVPASWRSRTLSPSRNSRSTALIAAAYKLQRAYDGKKHHMPLHPIVIFIAWQSSRMKPEIFSLAFSYLFIISYAFLYIPKKSGRQSRRLYHAVAYAKSIAVMRLHGVSFFLT